MTFGKIYEKTRIWILLVIAIILPMTGISNYWLHVLNIGGIFAICTLSLNLLTGCTGGTSSEESSTVSQAPLTDEDILAEVEPYLEDTVWQNPSAYAGMDEFLSANLALDSTQVAAVTIYMGAPNQNTSFFLMLTPTEEADTEVIREKLENKAEGMVNTAEMGYTQGYAGYKIIENVGRYFLVMQADAADFQELVQLLEGLED